MTQYYFRNFPFIKYSFGDNEPEVYFQKMSSAIDLFDNIKQDVSFTTKREILDFERPDTLSYKLYKTTDYYWTFFLMNDNLRESGWPLDVDREFTVITERYPYWSFITADFFAGLLQVGQELILTGIGAGGFFGKVVKADPSFGQIIFEPTFKRQNTQDVDGPPIDASVSDVENSFPSIQGMQFETNNVIYNLAGAFGNGSTTKEYLGVHHWENADGEYQDVNPLTQDITGVKRVTFKDNFQTKNQSLREISVLRPGIASQIVGEFQKLLASS